MLFPDKIHFQVKLSILENKYGDAVLYNYCFVPYSCRPAPQITSPSRVAAIS